MNGKYLISYHICTYVALCIWVALHSDRVLTNEDTLNRCARSSYKVFEILNVFNTYKIIARKKVLMPVGFKRKISSTFFRIT